MVKLDAKATRGPECNELTLSENGVAAGKEFRAPNALDAGTGWESHARKCRPAMGARTMRQTERQ
jgi:hypothetical protein